MAFHFGAGGTVCDGKYPATPVLNMRRQPDERRSEQKGFF
jgi:hypothetical protein